MKLNSFVLSHFPGLFSISKLNSSLVLSLQSELSVEVAVWTPIGCEKFHKQQPHEDIDLE